MNFQLSLYFTQNRIFQPLIQAQRTGERDIENGMSTLVLFIIECLHNINVDYYDINFTSTWLPLRPADPPAAMLPGRILITVESDS